jgi:hypothetical protein
VCFNKLAFHPKNTKGTSVFCSELAKTKNGTNLSLRKPGYLQGNGSEVVRIVGYASEQ